MKHTRTLISIALAAIMLLAGVAVCTSVSAAPGSSTTLHTPPVVGASSANGGAWDPLGGWLASDSSPAAVSSGIGRLDVFVNGGDGALWHKSYANGAWSHWESLGGWLASDSSPAAVSAGAMGWDVFVNGGDGALWRYSNYGGGWEPLGGWLASHSSPAAVSPGSVGWDVFVNGGDGALWHR